LLLLLYTFGGRLNYTTPVSPQVSLLSRITNDAVNSPQLVTINGTAVTAVTFAIAPGATSSASVSAGQTAQFNLQAMPGAGFSGTMTFACPGAPTAANCSAPECDGGEWSACKFRRDGDNQRQRNGYTAHSTNNPECATLFPGDCGAAFIVADNLVLLR
jgi:hypothetical protein